MKVMIMDCMLFRTLEDEPGKTLDPGEYWSGFEIEVQAIPIIGAKLYFTSDVLPTWVKEEIASELGDDYKDSGDRLDLAVKGRYTSAVEVIEHVITKDGHIIVIWIDLVEKTLARVTKDKRTRSC